MAKTVNAKEGSAWYAFNEVIDAMEVGEQLRIDDVAEFTKDTMEVCTDDQVAPITQAAIQKMVSKRKIHFIADLKVVSEKGEMMIYEKVVPEGQLKSAPDKPVSVSSTSQRMQVSSQEVNDVQRSYQSLFRELSSLKHQISVIANRNNTTPLKVIEHFIDPDEILWSLGCFIEPIFNIDIVVRKKF